MATQVWPCHPPGNLHLNCTTVIEWAGRITGSSGDQAPSNGATVTASGLPGMFMSPSEAPWMRQAAVEAPALPESLQLQRDRLPGRVIDQSDRRRTALRVERGDGVQGGVSRRLQGNQRAAHLRAVKRQTWPTGSIAA